MCSPDKVGSASSSLRLRARCHSADFSLCGFSGLSSVDLFVHEDVARGKPSGPLLGNGWPRRPRAFRSLHRAKRHRSITFRPKPRRIPRMLNSTSISCPRSCLRATSSARTSCDLIDSAWWRNQPIRISWASPHASLRSVFTVIADNFTCRVSSGTASNPAPFSPPCCHCDNGPASSPIRFTAKPSAAKKAPELRARSRFA
jgi:hypothetical protein